MCTEVDNSALKGHFFTDVGYPALDSSVSRTTMEKDFGFNEHQAITAVLHDEQNYLHGDFIPILRRRLVSNKSFIGGSNENLFLPNSNDAGLCNDFDAIKFGRKYNSGCLRMIHNLTSECTTHFGIDRFITGIFVSQKNTMLSPNTNLILEDGFVEMHMSELFSPVGDKVSLTTLDPPYTRWDDEANICRQALQKLSYEIYYDMQNTITSVKISAHSVDIPIGAKGVRQYFSVSFIPIGSNEFVDNQIAVEPRPRSGNPGYIFGLPTLAGTALNEDDKIYSDTLGLTVRNGGKCDTLSHNLTVGFGEDMVVGCTISLTLAMLEDLCTSLTNPLLQKMNVGSQIIFVPRWLIQHQDVVGIFGNADPLVRNQWIPIFNGLDKPDAAVRSRMWLPQEAKCDGVVTHLRLYISWTHVGSTHNPQAKIVSAVKEHEASVPLVHNSPFEDKEKFHFTTTVTWIYVDPENILVKPREPSLLLNVPNDIFYPFQISSSNEQKIIVQWSFLMYGWVIAMLI